jgi:TatD DNase family protein
VWIDTHCHLGHQRFSEDLAEVIQRAQQAGVDAIVAPAVDLANAAHLLRLREQHPLLHPAIGIHPCDADSVSATDFRWMTEMAGLASQPGVAAIGEIGLDFFHPPPVGFNSDQWRTQQLRVVKAQLDHAAEVGLNVIIHTRESHAEMLDVLRAYTGRLRAVFHCFTGTAEQAKELVGLGHLVSFTGIVTFKNSPSIQATAKALPEDAFMVETDAPYLAPMPHRGKRCEPAHVVETGCFIAQLRESSVAHIAAVTSRTAREFFHGLPAARIT